MAIRGLPRHSWPITLHASHQGASHHGACIPRMHPPHASPARTCMSPLNSSASLSTRESSWYPSHLALAARTRRGWRAHKNSTRAPWSTDEPSMARSRIIRSACSARAALCQRGNQRQTEDAIRRCNQEARNGEQKMQSEDAIRRCNQEASNGARLLRLHHQELGEVRIPIGAEE